MSVCEYYCDKCNVPDDAKYHRENRKSWEACYWAARNRHQNCVQFLCNYDCLFNVLHTTNDNLSDEQDGYDNPDD